MYVQCDNNIITAKKLIFFFTFLVSRPLLCLVRERFSQFHLFKSFPLALLYLINSGCILEVFLPFLFLSPGFFIWEISCVSTVNEVAMLFLFRPGHFYACLSTAFMSKPQCQLQLSQGRFKVIGAVSIIQSLWPAFNEGQLTGLLQTRNLLPSSRTRSMSRNNC